MEYTSLTNTKQDPDFTKTFVNSISSQYNEKVCDKFISLDATIKKKKLNSKNLKKFGINSIPRDMIKYDLYKEMHQLWKEYAKQVKEYLKMEIVGSILTVLESKNLNVVGLEGICVRETSNIFYLITKSDKLVKIPKVNTIFSLENGNSLIKIYGNNFRFRPADRSNKKIKHNPTIEL